MSVTITPDRTKLLVADWGNSRLVTLDVADGGRPLVALKPTYGVLSRPAGAVMVPHTGQVLATDLTSRRLVLFGGIDDPTVVRMFGEGQSRLEGPFGVALVLASDGIDLEADPTAAAAAATGLDTTLVAVADRDNSCVVMYRLRDATYVRRIGSDGSKPGQFSCPRSVAVVPSSYTSSSDGCCAWLAVTDDGNHRVQVVSQIGVLVHVLAGDAANGLGPFSHGLLGITVCVDADGHTGLLVSDTWNHRVVAFRLDGSTARVVCGTGQAGRGAGELNAPAGLAVTATGELWVVESENHRLSLFR
jgi:hypothetical protein